MIVLALPYARGVLRADKGTGAVQALFNSHTSCAYSDWLALATHVHARYFYLDCAQPQQAQDTPSSSVAKRPALTSASPGSTIPLGPPLLASGMTLTREAVAPRAASARWSRIVYAETSHQSGRLHPTGMVVCGTERPLIDQRLFVLCRGLRDAGPPNRVDVKITQRMVLKNHSHSCDKITITTKQVYSLMPGEGWGNRD